MERDLIGALLQCELFREIDRADIENLLTTSTYTVKSYTKNDVFALAGDRVNYLMLVLDGVLITRMVSESGKHVQIDRIEVGRIIASAMLYATKSIFPVNVIPDTNTTVFFMHKDIFLKSMLKNERLLFNFIQIVSDIHHFLAAKIHSLSLKSIRGKLAEYILRLSNEQGETNIVVISLTRQELADKFAVSRQAVSRSLSELEDDGLIQVKTKTIIILNSKELRQEE